MVMGGSVLYPERQDLLHAGAIQRCHADDGRLAAVWIVTV